MSGSVERGGGFVEDGVEGLEDMRNQGSDVEGDLDVGDGGLAGEAEGVVEEDLVGSGLDEQGRQAGQVGEDGADEAESGVLPGGVVADPGPRFSRLISASASPLVSMASARVRSA